MNAALVTRASLLVVLTLAAATFGAVVRAPSAAAAGNLTDAQFFGSWDGSAWTVPSKINYGYSSSLAPVEQLVKAGDYEGAKQALHTYVTTRTNRTVPPLTSGHQDRAIADLAVNDTFPGPQADRLVGELTIPAAPSPVSVAVTSSVAGAALGSKRVTFMLMGKVKEAQVARLDSRESESHPPRLRVTVGDTVHDVAPDKDTYIRGGSAATFGAETSLLVNASGLPYDDGEHRAYLSFDLSGLPTGAPAAAASLELHGASGSGAEKPLYVFEVSNASWSESAMSWTNTAGSIYSWQGAATGTDWNSPAHADVEYVNWLSRHYFLRPMAYEYHQGSRDPAYARHAVRIMRDFLVDKPAAYNRTLEVGVRSVHWVEAHHHFRQSHEMTAADNTEILKFLWQQAEYLSRPSSFTPSNNWGVIQSNGLFYIASYLPELAAAEGWLDTAETRLLQMANTLIKDDGSYIEGTTTYTAVVAQLYLQTKQMAAVNDIAIEPALDQRIHRLITYLMDSTHPTGTDVMYGDSDETDNRPLIMTYGDLYADPGLRYFGSGGSQGTPSPRTSAFYPIGMVAAMRSGWNATDAYLHVNNQNFPGHGHPDLLHIDVSAHGQRLLIDPGRNTYNDDPVSNWLRRTTQAHNTITIDGAAQVKSTPVFTTAWESNGGFDFFEGLHRGYAGFAHSRAITFVKPGFWIVSDHVAAPAGSHDYEQNWHYLPTSNVSLDPTTATASTAFPTGADIQVVPADPAQLTASMRSGYYAPGYGAAVPASYTSFERRAAGDVSYDTVLFPTASGERRDVRLSRLTTRPAVAPTVASALRVDTDAGDGGDLIYYYLSHEATTERPDRRFDRFGTDGRLAMVRTAADGALESAHLADGRTVRQGGNELITSSRPISDVSVAWRGRTLEIHGSGLRPGDDPETAVAIFAPAARSVTLNGERIPHTRDGRYIYAVANADEEVTIPVRDAAASSVHNAAWRPSNVGDGDPGTAWSSARQVTATGTQWIAVDTGGLNAIDDLTLVPRLHNGAPLAFPEDFRFQSSVDGITWTDIPGQSHMGYPVPANGSGERFTFATVHTRYVRVVATKFRTDGTNYYVQLAGITLRRGV